MTIPDKDVQAMLEYIEEWEEAGAIGHIILSVLPGRNDEVGTVNYFTFGPKEGTPEQVKLFGFMDQILDAIGTRILRQ